MSPDVIPAKAGISFKCVSTYSAYAICLQIEPEDGKSIGFRVIPYL